MDFGALPPEINSGRMYTGPGSGPMVAAAEAWDGLAAELHSAAAHYSSALSGLTAKWQGPSSLTMAAAAAPYVAWLTGTAVQAEQAASQARAAAAAYEAAFAATVPPAAVTANRAQLLALIATNFFGQNTPAIMETQAQYLEMWAQDAAAMYGYAGSSASAATLPPFGPPPRTTEPAGAAGQAAAVAQATGTQAGARALPPLMSAVPSSLHGLAGSAAAAPATTSPSASAPQSLASALNSLVAFGNGPLSPLSYFSAVGAPQLLGAQSYLLPQAGANLSDAMAKLGTAPAIAAASGPVSPTGALGSAVTAGVNRAGFVGGLSVPQGWAMAAPAVKPVAAVFADPGPAGAAAAAATQGEGNLFGNVALSSLAGRAIADTGGTAARSAGAGASGEAAGPVNIFIIPALPPEA
ncbi:PPE family protein [Mycobacterium servetii]|uniref:PPE family protein n=1 Tax=Mycobacterium servetii TaxID=3237418 RepID=UPI0035109488